MTRLQQLRRDLFSHQSIVAGMVGASAVQQAILDRTLRRDEVLRYIPASTLTRKVRQKLPLSREEADQLSRLLRIKAYAEEVFGSAGVAETWLDEPNPALSGQPPADLLVTDEGTLLVETLLRRIDYGDHS